MERQNNGWIVWVEPNEVQTVEGAHWKAWTVNNDSDTEYGFGDTAQEAVGDLIGVLTRFGAATIREIHTRGMENEILYPADENKKRMLG